MRFAQIVAVLLAAAPGSVGAQSLRASPATRTVIFTPAQMLGLAELAQQKGDISTSSALYVALEANPDADIRAEARFRHARQLIALKRNTEAAILLRRVVDDKPEAVAARLELAHALQLLGNTNAALRELRNVQSSGLPPAVARLIDRYSAGLRARRPFGASVEIGIAPDSNINRATRSDTLGTVFGEFQITDDGQAKSGTGLSLDAQVFRRLPVAASTNLVLRASGFANLYRRGRFNEVAADLAVGPEFSLGRDPLQLEFGATQRWFGQKPNMRAIRLAGTFSHALGLRTLLRVSGSASLIDNQFNNLQDGKGYSGQLQIERALTPTTGVVASLALDRQALKDPGYSTTGWRGGLTGWHDLGRMTFTATAQIGQLHADQRLVLFPDRRRDSYTRLSLGASSRRLQYAGFAPVLRFSVERNHSSIVFYDYRRTRTEMAIVRAF
jgi:hypothetical protein